MKKIIFKTMVLCMMVMVPFLWAQNKEIQKLHQDAVADEEATYDMEVKSPFGSSKMILNLQVTKVAMTNMRVRKLLKRKGNDYIKNNEEFPLTGDFLEQLQKQVEKGWESPQVQKEVDSSPDNLSLDEKVEVTTKYRTKGGVNVPQKTTTSQKSSFTCYKVTFKVSGSYPKRSRPLPESEELPKPATMIVTYWICPEVPVFGIVKSEGTLTQNIQGVEVKAKTTMELKKYVEFKIQ